jgi:ribosomal protein L33
MAWQKNKILLVSTEIDPESGKKVFHRYVVRKSKGKGKNVGQPVKLKLKKYNPALKRHVEYTETKYK